MFLLGQGAAEFEEALIKYLTALLVVLKTKIWLCTSRHRGARGE